MLDVDGTLVPYDYAALPSPCVIAAVQEACRLLSVCIATGRSYAFARPVLDSLKMHSGFAIINDGALVVDLKTKEKLYEQTMLNADAELVIQTLRERQIPFYVDEKEGNFRNVLHHKPRHVYGIYTDETLTAEVVDGIISDLSHIRSLSIQRSHHKILGLFGLHASHVKATKQEGIFEVAKLLGIQTHEIIGVGDGYNDFPLLMACGLKIAMGNAIDDLKAVADYVAPPVEEDGVAHVIDKYVLNPTS